MHKLLIRQLKRYRRSEEIPDDWREFISAVDQAYQDSEKEFLMMEHNLDFTSQELSSRNTELQSAFDKLKLAQTSLIHSEKMAGLGNLIAGIAHEINTPASAISSAILEIKKDYAVLFEQLINIVASLPKESCEIYLDAAKKLLGMRPKESTMERRDTARKLMEFFTSEDIPDARSMSQNLALIGFNAENLKPYLSLFKIPQRNLIVQSFFDLGMSQIHVSDINIAIDRIIFLVRALKSYSHAGQTELVITDIKEDISNTLVILHNKLKRAVHVTTEFSEIPKIKCYADQLNQVWTNIINNAVEAMQGEGNIIIRVKQLDQEKIQVEIEDNGPGIPKDIMSKIYEPYFTTKAKGEGTGLGLSISKKIVEENQGTIELESQEGKTVFRVILPVEVKIAEERT